MYQIKWINLLNFTPGIILISGVISACSTATTDPVRVEADFGNSVKNMVDAQIIDHEAAEALVAKPVIGIDGVRAEKILHDHRSVGSNAEAVSAPINLDIDNN